MVYMGGKQRLSKYIVPILQKYIDNNDITTYIEPFVGGGNIIGKVKCDKKYGYDNAHYLIALLQNIDKVKELPDIVTKEEYDRLRKAAKNGNPDHIDDWYIGAFKYIGSFRGSPKGTFVGEGKIHTKSGDINFWERQKRNVLRQIPELDGCIFEEKDYRDIKNVSNCLIYCDPPYKSAEGYGSPFNHAEYYEWAKEMSKSNIVICSETQMPDDWEIIWEKEVKRTVVNSKGKKATEKLFKLKENI